MPPKNITSVMRKSHIPSVEASFCWASVSNCTRNWGDSAWASLANFNLLPDYGGVIVDFVSHDGCYVEIMHWRRRGGLPLQAGCAPRIGAGHFAIAQRPDEIDHGHQVPDGQHGCAGGGKHVQHLKLVGVDMIAPRHPQISQNELREKRQVESQEDDERGELGPTLRIHAAGDLGPPVMQAAEVGHDGAAHHDVVEMRHHKVSVGNMHVEPQGGYKEASKPTDGEQSDEAEGIEHGGGERNGALVESGRPVEYLDSRRDGHKVAEERKDQSGVYRLGGHEQVMAPDQEAQHGDRHAGVSHEFIAEDRLAGKDRDQFADDAHGGQDP